jgi:uncharacterized protein YjiS (DUF1127 family)
LEIEPVNLLKNILSVWALHREFRAVLAELNGYSDRELSELGLARGDVARVAYAEAERRIATPSPSHAEAPALELCPDACLLGCSGSPGVVSAGATT